MSVFDNLENSDEHFNLFVLTIENDVIDVLQKHLVFQLQQIGIYEFIDMELVKNRINNFVQDNVYKTFLRSVYNAAFKNFDSWEEYCEYSLCADYKTITCVHYDNEIFDFTIFDDNEDAKDTLFYLSECFPILNCITFDPLASDTNRYACEERYNFDNSDNCLWYQYQVILLFKAIIEGIEVSFKKFEESKDSEEKN